jgi:hypothetical protein
MDNEIAHLYNELDNESELMRGKQGDNSPTHGTVSTSLSPKHVQET